MKKCLSFIIAVLLLILPLFSCENGNGTELPTEQSHGTEESKAVITKITINGAEQDLETVFIEYKLTPDDVRIPVVEAEKSEGEGELIIEQAISVPGTAYVTLNEVKYTIMFDTDMIFEESELQNTYRNLVSEKKLNVAYIGGSVTVGAFGDAGKSYRDLTTKWFRDHFDAQITETNAGIGGTGCFLGAYRTIQHLKLDNKTARPDLVFIEFAVNDIYDGTSAEEIKCYAETMIQAIYHSNPYADIIILIVGEQSTLDREEPEAWRTVASYYHLPVVELTRSLLTDIRKEGKKWSDFVADSVHPNNNGYAKYASYIAELLQAELLDKQVSPFAATERTFPDQTLSNKVLSDLTFYETFQMPISKNSGFQPEGPDAISGGIAATTVGATLNFSFSGTGLTLFLGNNDPVVVEYTIDGIKYEDIKVAANKFPSLADGLENGTHKVMLRVKSITSGSFFLRRILVRGNTERKAVKILSE